jgi:hypothetical protein
LAIDGGSRQLGDEELALDLGQIGEVPQAEGHQELPGRFVEEGPAGRFLAAADADEPALEEVVQHGIGVDAAHGVDLGT